MDSAPLQLSGLATGLDTSAIVQQLMAIEHRPVDLLQSRQAAEQTKLDHLRSLNTKLSALQNAAESLIGLSFNLSSLSAKSATSSNTALFSAKAENTATAGNYSVQVTQLAKEQKTGGGTFNVPAAAGSLTIGDGTTSTDIAIAAGATAADVAAAINAADAGMTASVVKDGSGNDALVLTGEQTGVTYTVDDTNGGTFASDMGIDSTGNTYQAAQQAQVTIDGMFTYTSDSNQITDAIPGVTINAVAVGTASLSVSRDNSAAVGKMKDFVAKYNDIVKQIKEDTKYDSESKKGGPFLGDSFVTSLSSQLNQQLTNQFQLKQADGTFAATTGYSYYNDLGIEVQRDGTLALDESKFSDALAADPDKVYALLGQEDGVTRSGGTVDVNGASDGIAQRMIAFVDTYISTSSRYLDVKDASGARYSGLMVNRLNMGQDRIDDYNDRIDAYERRLEIREQTIRAQFLAMEQSVASIRNQGNYLAGQFAQMSGYSG